MKYSNQGTTQTEFDRWTSPLTNKKVSLFLREVPSISVCHFKPVFKQMLCLNCQDFEMIIQIIINKNITLYN